MITWDALCYLDPQAQVGGYQSGEIRHSEATSEEPLRSPHVLDGEGVGVVPFALKFHRERRASNADLKHLGAQEHGRCKDHQQLVPFRGVLEVVDGIGLQKWE